MEKIFNWRVTPAAGRMTINGENAAGRATKVTNVVTIAPVVRRGTFVSKLIITATRGDRTTYELA